MAASRLHPAGMLPFAYVWPYVGLGAAGLLLLLLTTATLRGTPAVPRRRDLVWLAWAATCAYLVHQFEEHGVDARGEAYAFRGELCAVLGYPDAASCPVPPAFITAVNVAAVWLAGPASALLGRRWPALALSFFSVPAVNAVVHVAAAIGKGAYNPGLVTAMVLFVPLSLAAFRVALRHPDVGLRAVLATMLGGVLIHAVLLGSLRAYLAGGIGLGALLAIQVVNPFLPMLLVALARCGAQPKASVSSDR